MKNSIKNYRILDANANRAFEGLRTLEEVARFHLDHSSLTHRLKQLRHDLQSSMDRFDRVQLLAARDTTHDVGTQASTKTELDRPDLASIVGAASGRVQQALRCLEEFSKPLDVEAAIHFESLRYRCYDLFAELELRTRSKPFPESGRLYLLVDCSRPLDEFRTLVGSLANSGVDFFQLRDKTADDRTLLEYARAIQSAIQPSSAHLIVNDRIDIAMCVEAAGIHLGQEDLPIEEVRRIVGAKMWIGVSTHSLEQVEEAIRAGADYIGCGPTFPSTTKSFASFAGTDFLRQVADRCQRPSFAIGGIDLSNLDQVVEAGFCRIAVSGAILNAPTPERTARQIADRLSSPFSLRK